MDEPQTYDPTWRDDAELDALLLAAKVAGLADLDGTPGPSRRGRGRSRRGRGAEDAAPRTRPPRSEGWPRNRGPAMGKQARY